MRAGQRPEGVFPLSQTKRGKAAAPLQLHYEYSVFIHKSDNKSLYWAWRDEGSREVLSIVTLCAVVKTGIIIKVQKLHTGDVVEFQAQYLKQ